MTKEEVLKQYFGYDSFRNGQAELVDNILAGRDVLGVMPTGAGKSVCYQVPAMLLYGTVVVISPLISLMKDQIEALLQNGIPAGCLNSAMSDGDYARTLAKAYNNEYKVIYAAPERLVTEGFLNLCREITISMVTVDEAHCVSQWGQDFRPSYLKIIEFVKLLPYRPIISAFTATATSDVREDIVRILQLNEPFTITTGFDRPNLFFGVQKPKDKFAALLKIIDRNRGRCGIVYCISRKLVEEVCERLCEAGYSATRYHAGLSPEERRANQEAFIYDEKQLVVATNAFGMGIDKSNVSFVVHYNMPKNIESYYQEAGRAGRDGEPAECIMLYSGQDCNINRFLIENGENGGDLTPEVRAAVRQKDMERLKYMTYYSTATSCLREFILRYFGEKAPAYCGNCSCCLANYELCDITLEAKKIISCVFRLKQRNRSFGVAVISSILRGTVTEKYVWAELETLSTYGIMKDESTRRIREITRFLIQEGYLTLSADEYPVVELAPKSDEIIRGGAIVKMKLLNEEDDEKREKREKQSKKVQAVYAYDAALFDELRKLRADIARNEGVPAYTVFSDATIRNMCVSQPLNSNKMLEVSGVGKVKLERYGERFIAAIKTYTMNGSTRDDSPVAAAEGKDGITVAAKNADKLSILEQETALTQFCDNLITQLGVTIKTSSLTKAVRQWLVDNGYLEKKEKGTTVTDKGLSVGIESIHRVSPKGLHYVAVVFSQEGQRFLIDNLANIAKNSEK